MSKEGSQDGPQNQPEKPGEKKEDVFESRKHKQIIRIVTVMAYMFAVSSMGMTLSGYYLFLWQPPNPKLISHVRNPLKLVAHPDMHMEKHSDMSPPIPMALQSGPGGQTHDSKILPRANGDLFLKKLFHGAVEKDVQVSTTPEDVNDTLATTVDPDKESVSSTNPDEDERGTVRLGQSILEKVSVLSSSLRTNDDGAKETETKSGTTLGRVLGLSAVRSIDGVKSRGQ